MWLLKFLLSSKHHYTYHLHTQTVLFWGFVDKKISDFSKLQVSLSCAQAPILSISLQACWLWLFFRVAVCLILAVWFLQPLIKFPFQLHINLPFTRRFHFDFQRTFHFLYISLISGYGLLECNDRWWWFFLPGTNLFLFVLCSCCFWSSSGKAVNFWTRGLLSTIDVVYVSSATLASCKPFFSPSPASP